MFVDYFILIFFGFLDRWIYCKWLIKIVIILKIFEEMNEVFFVLEKNIKDLVCLELEDV